MLPDTGEQLRISEILGFTERQREAQEAAKTYRYILYGGARGGGKSRWLRWMALYLLLRWYFVDGLTNVSVGLFCASYPDLRDRQISKISQEFPQIFGKLSETKEHGLGFHLSEKWGGGHILLRNLDDPDKYKSAEFAAVLVDELTLLPDKRVFDILRGSLRYPGVGWTLFLAASNPDGPGNLWVRELWIEGKFPPEMKDIAGLFKFIPALPSDNPHLDESYWNDLRSQPHDVQRAWIEGDWYVYSGQGLRFRRDVHVCKPFEIPEHWTRKTGYDWGNAKPMCYLWGARDPDNGRWVVYRELYQAGLTDPRQAELVKQYEEGDEHIIRRYADPSVFTKRTLTDNPTSTSDIFRSHGLLLTPAINNRIAGKRKVDGLLEVMSDGKPGLLVFETCTNGIRTLPSLVYDKKRPEDIDSSGEDHWYDALRYMLTDDITAVQAKKKQKRVPGPFEGVKGL